MYRLKIGGLALPPLYICESRRDATECKKKGVPYLIKPKSMDSAELIKWALLTTLRSKFPHINWFGVLGIERNKRKELIVKVPGCNAMAHSFTGSNDGTAGDVIVDQAEDTRSFLGGFDDGEDDYADRPLGSYIGDFSAEVKIEELQALHLLPTFLDDVAEAIRRNLYGLEWSEGYNKKYGVPIGNFDTAYEAVNLMILDVSGSIPRGISSTMLTLIDTLRTQANADLIITGSCSKFWRAGDELPDPQWIRNRIGLGNEASQFYSILKKEYANRKIGNLICFGDDDCPEWYEAFNVEKCELKDSDLSGTTVENMLSFHTCSNKTPGYAKWAKELGCKSEVINSSWCRYMD